MAELPSVGVHPTATDLSMPILELARETEARGLRSLYLPEHTHVPVDSMQITPTWTMSERYQRTLDPYIATAFIAATTSLEVGTGISLVAEHDAIALAKAVATLDAMSDGRVVLGVGYGYNRGEAEDHGVDWQARATVVEETVALMRALWTKDVGEFEGRYRRVSPSWSWPKPTQPGGPPVLLGARATARTLQRIVDWADGWIPMGPIMQTDPAFPTFLHELRQRWRDAGRAGEPQICYFFDPGDRDEMARQIEKAASFGIQRMQVFLEDRTRGDALPILDELAAAVSAVTA